MDVVLADQTGPFTSTWDGKTLTKEGLGLLQLSSVNTYTGSTLINAGTLQTGIANAFATSGDVNIASNATLDLNSFAQQANNLAGSGHITLGSGVLTANSNADTIFNGDISGTGSLIKAGASQLTLSGLNLYSGGTTISAGTLKATQSGALGSGSITNSGTLELNFAADNSLSNILSGNGSLVKTGVGNATLSGVGSSQGAINVNQGALTLAQSGAFNASSLTTDTDATISLGIDSALNISGALTQNSGATLDVTLGTINPLITAGSAALDGVLNVTGLDTSDIPTQASELATARWNIIHTTSGIIGDFSSVNLSGASSSVDYLTLAGRIVNGVDYSVGFGLTWLEGSAQGNGIFTLAESDDNFNVDVVLADRTGPFTSGWDGKTLTKEGLGTLQLSSVNTYTGSTLINQGTLLAGVANAFASSSDVSIASDATLNLNNLAQQANNLSGTGHIILGTAALTTNNNTDTTFGGTIDGNGSLNKLGAGTLTLSGTNSYSNGTTISAGRLKATQGDALGTGDITNNATLELNFASDSVLDNVLSGTGDLVKSGDGKATLTGVGSSQNNVEINDGTLTLALGDVFSAGDLNTADGAIIDIAEDTTVELSGALTQSNSAALNVALGSSTSSIITADSAILSGTLNITGFAADAPASASELANSQYTIVHTLNGITGDFSSVNLGGATSAVDYLTLAGKVVNGTDYDVGLGLTWLAGNTPGNGTFTLTNLTDNFNVDVVLADQTGTFVSGWDGKSLTKEGLGLLQLSSVNTYTGSTLINAGTLRAGIANAFTSSSNVNIASDATLDLNNLAQQTNDLSGTGHITLGSGVLTANNLNNTSFGGDISGSGSLIKTGTGILTLSGLSNYSGGTVINAGTLKATQGGVAGSGSIANNSIFELNFVGNSTLENVLTGNGNLIKTGAGNATLTGTGSVQGAINVNSGTLTLAQGDTFTASSLNTATGATTAIASDTQLNIGGALVQSDGAILNVALGSTQPIITANTATLDGALNISGFTTGAPDSASELTSTAFTIVHTTGGITGDFSSLSLGGATSSVDYLTLTGKVVNGLDYNVGFGLTWEAGSALGNGTFTLTNTSDNFNADVVLADQSGIFASGWDGKSLTKEGLGTLQLSSANTYTGSTRINNGTLQTGIADAFTFSSEIVVGSNATLDLNDFNQQANNLSGSGSILLGSAELTANNSLDTTLSGVIDGSGSLMKEGTGTLTLSGINTYQGGTTISRGTLVINQGGALGSGSVNNGDILELDFSGSSTLSNLLSGSGYLVKTGSGIAILDSLGSTQGNVAVNQGTLVFAQNGIFNADLLTTADGATTSLAGESILNLSGALIQNTSSVLNVAVGSGQTAINADTASLGGSLYVTGFNASEPTSASALADSEFTVIHTVNGITNDFSTVNLGDAASSVDYLTLAGRIVNNSDYNVGFGLTWQAGDALGNGTFTLANAGDLFNVDVVLADQTGTFTSGWDGKTLTKQGLGTLQLSSVNTYTGSTLINGGTLQTGIANAFATSSDITVASGATLDLNGFDQQANNLSGSGSILLGSAGLTANNNTNTGFSGAISGAGSLSKTGTGTLTLSGVNSYQGGSTLSAGTLVATQGSALGSGAVDNGATLELNFAGDSTLANVLSGSGALTKTGAGVATLSGSGSTQGVINVNQGTLNFAQSGVFNGSSLTTADAAITSVAADSSLNLTGGLTQNSTAVLNVAVGSVQPVITADTATLDGTLNITGFTTGAPTSASALTNTEFKVIHTTGGITGDFSTVNLSGATSNVDYLILAGKVVNGLDYNVGFGLTWQAGDALGNGTFTLANAGDLFNVDVVLADQTGTFTSGWDGKTLTKQGLGTLQLSSVNTYTGSTLINGGTLQTGIANAFATSSDITVASGATLDLNGFDQQANNLSGSGSILLGSAGLTANNSTNTTFSGAISGAGSLSKTGTGTLTLSGVNSYQGGSTLSAGTLVATQGSALGSGAVDNGATLELNFAGDSTLANVLSGSGALTKTGAGVATLSGSGSTQGVINVNQGTLNFAQSGVFNGSSLTTADAAITSVAADSSLNLTGGLTQNSTAALNVAVGSVQPVITADTATLDGTLNITGFTTGAPTSASALTNTEFNVIHTTGGITGDFATVNLSGAASNVDYLILAGRVVNNIDYNVGFGLTWQAGDALGNGTFTLANAGDLFNVDVVLADQTGTFTSGWNGKTLTKQGVGTLQLSSVNTYTGSTLINGGTLQTGIANAFATSSDITVASGATLDLNGFDQQANNLSGTGHISLGSATLTANNTGNTAFSGDVNGTGSLIKTGTGVLTLSGLNTYSGGSTISAGTLKATQGGILGSGMVTNNGILLLDFLANSTLVNSLAGSGTLIKVGSGNATLNGAGSSQGLVNVDGGTLTLAQGDTFVASSLNTASGATTAITNDTRVNISGGLIQSNGATLNVALGTTPPTITANTAALDGALNISGFTTNAPTNASELINTQFTIIHTTGGITGDFSSVSLGGATNSADYLQLTSHVVNGLDYNIGFGLTWEAGDASGNGTFTLTNASDSFNVDVALADQTGTFTSGWDGHSLTKEGLGTLQLSSVNTYTGSTLINNGTLQTGIANTFATSSDVNIGGSGTLALNGFAQQANNLSGIGHINLGSAALTANNTANSTFSGDISGAGSVIKIGTGELTLSGLSNYSGGSTINTGILKVTQGGTLGTGTVSNNSVLQLDFAGDSTLTNVLSGSGNLLKSGAGNATLNGMGSSQGAININAGTLTFAQGDVFNASSLTTTSGSTLALATDASLNLSGALTQQSNATLSVRLGSVEPLITASTATLSGTLKVEGIDTSGIPDKASEIPNGLFTIIHTTGGISGDFDSVDLNGASSSADYLVVNAAKSLNNNDYNVGFGLTWLAGADLGNGTFTLVNQDDTFNVDIALLNSVASATGWDGKSLTKEGAGTLILSAANLYTGNTQVNNGQLRTDIANAFANSSSVVIGNNGTLNLNSFDQQLNNLTGSGKVILGNAVLTANNNAASTFDGVINGYGSVTKTGSEALTLSGMNFYSGGTTITQGRLIGTQGNALGVNEIANNAELELAFAQNSILNNQLTGSGSLIKSGGGIAILTHNNSSQGNVSVNQGVLHLTQEGVFNAANYNSAAGATTSLATNATLAVSNQFNIDGVLDVVARGNPPLITAGTANIGSAAVINVAGYSAPETATASQLANSLFTIIQTSAPGNLTGHFASGTAGGAVSPVDYLSITSINDGYKFDVGLALSWYAAHTGLPAKATGNFTLTAQNEYFDLDALLMDEVANAASGWDGKSLTKAGAGTLELSKANLYTGATLINGGTLLAGHTDIIAQSSQLNVGEGATFDLNSFDQHVNNLTGSGNVVLGNAQLMANNSLDSTFSGVIDGFGSLSKTGNGALILTNDNTFTGSTTINEGTLQLGNGGTTGRVTGAIINNAQLTFNHSDDYAYGGVISGSGILTQQGTGQLSFNQNQTYSGVTNVNAGRLVLMNDALLANTPSVSVAEGAILGGYGGVGGDVTNHGLLAVADALPGMSDSPAGVFTVGGQLVNSGELRMASPLPASQLVVKGNYVGNNGLLTLSTVLGDDNSATDKLIVQGDTSGSTRVVVNNSGGNGASTVNGIEIIRVGGQSNGQFTLANRVVAGAYEYSLNQGLPTQADGNWYLRSVSDEGDDTPQWRPESGAYLGNQSMAALMQIHTLFDRQGAQYTQNNGSSWGRIIGGHTESNAAGGHVGMEGDYTLVQFGSDMATYQQDTQRLQVGLMGSWGNGDTDATGNSDLNGVHHSATGSLNGFNLGAYATWFADAQQKSGAYVDSWTQYGWYDNDVQGEGQGSDSYDSRLWSSSLEVGYSLMLNP
ncbi:autotransporter-associated beta strand repeat-containing protein [Budviciaceae bacterium BWR-B9]|uniref:Autotransporter-associated beta strand repeat-containing protein n=1 Tax=Limnobaculum allomyrinae TaxID=2791986 RepID=A0ABS1IP78_9GAMM|nr:MULTISPECIES: autotransporter-associated beta strand repeat-containing protein [Limnobaculum]MBK5143568.1 autotransporter-associated beta strand repeat-containing protein [Limnobaculum allomyrinae]MBV7691456.1 autotransporter-associated beta strand repeat-containing protein [Limnobaculum sp. M2-1]